MRIAILFSLMVYSLSGSAYAEPQASVPAQVADVKQVTDTQNKDQDFINMVQDIKNPFVLEIEPTPVLKQEIKIVPAVSKPKVVKKIVPKIKPKPVIRPSIHVSGIVWSKDFRQAVIENQILTIGQRVNGAKILHIYKEGISILYRGKRFYYKVDEADDHGDING